MYVILLLLPLCYIQSCVAFRVSESATIIVMCSVVQPTPCKTEVVLHPALNKRSLLVCGFFIIHANTVLKGLKPQFAGTHCVQHCSKR